MGDNSGGNQMNLNVERFTSAVTSKLIATTNCSLDNGSIVENAKILDEGDISISMGNSLCDFGRKYQENSQIIESLGIGIWKWDLRDNSLEWDDNMYRLYGVDRNEFNGAYDAWENSLSSETKEKALAELYAAVRGEKDFDTTFQVVHKTGKIQEIRTRAFVIRDENGKALKMHGINVDRTREAELEKKLERERVKALQNAKLASLGEMSAGIAHEINNPLAVISGAVRTLNGLISNPEKFQSRIELIEGASERIAKIVRSLRKFSRSDEKSKREKHSVLEIVNESLVLIGPKSRRFMTPIDVEAKCSGIILCDEIEIEQVVVNLLSNAIDAVKNMENRWVRVELSEEDAVIVLRVIDSGFGINHEIKQKLFQPFFTTKPIGEGTGLGLSIVKGILDEHGASVEINSNLPNTCFEVRFPKLKD